MAQTTAARVGWNYAALYLLVCLVLRAGLLGDWNHDVDDQFYALVGHRMLSGDSLYVDIWDRKGPLLYLTYAALALFGKSPVPFQLAATAAVALGAWGIASIAARLADPRGALLAGLSYCVLVMQFGGAGGQAAIFFEPLLIAGFASLLASRAELASGRLNKGLLAGFLCAGLALAFKQSAIYEAAFLGLAAVALQWRGRVAPVRLATNSAMLALTMALPLLLCLGWFALAGQLGEFWLAMVSSNLNRSYMPIEERLHRLPIVATEMALPLGFALYGGWSLRSTGDRADLRLVGLWALVAVGAVLTFPNLIHHYLLTTLPPLCVLAAGLYRRGLVGIGAAVGLAIAILPFNDALHWAERSRSREDARVLAHYVKAETPDRRLLIWGFPSYLYLLADAPPPRPLAFPPHLFDASERTSSGRDATEEVRKILAAGPSTVVVQVPLPASPLNTDSVALVEAYLRSCARQREFELIDQYGPQLQRVYSGCRAI